ncbi:MAG: hypothetical protein IKE42_22810 [Aquamicrobium sp.]|uniref:hypothetical protein n=1 Tax=Mesorhizobium sp. Pch-S TaxID=2082387 RepID=UPI001013798B|nr:hypothetical protein [Mesorhizobium sp. Pch-S]MBR2690695.1 hypothetical protein [Aquamicrobium sp.]QAZ47144.1 hypothetical protein C1M53_12165 [Mesorhizobium sp. Pch-S]
MNRFAAYFIRCLVILFGYAVAVLAASAFINVLFLGAIGFSAEETRWLANGPLVVTVPLLAVFVGYFAFAPSALLILATELLARRDWLFYALGGGVVAGIVLGVAWQSGDPDFAATDTRIILGIVGAGMVGGIFYWLSAGRWAGSWWQDSIDDGQR